jgi:hypothetical protein
MTSEILFERGFSFIRVERTFMRFPLTILLFLAAANFCHSQNKREQDFNSAVNEVILAFSKQDSLILSKFIHPDIGIYLLHRVGVFDTYKNFKKIGFSDQSYPSILMGNSSGIKRSSLHYSLLPAFDCETGWSKTGLFVDTARKDHLLSKICKERNQNGPDSIPAKPIKSFVNLENNSRRIVLVDKNHRELVFYLAYIKNKWYLVMLDTVTSDCSA